MWIHMFRNSLVMHYSSDEHVQIGSGPDASADVMFVHCTREKPLTFSNIRW